MARMEQAAKDRYAQSIDVSLSVREGEEKKRPKISGAAYNGGMLMLAIIVPSLLRLTGWKFPKRFRFWQTMKIRSIPKLAKLRRESKTEKLFLKA